MADSEPIRAFLSSLKLDNYADNFLQNGYDDVSCLKSIDEKDLDAMNITLPGHRKRILQNASTWSPTAPSAAPVAAPEEEAPKAEAPKAAESAPPPAVRPKPAVAPPPRPASTANPPVPPRTPDKPATAPPSLPERQPPSLPERQPALPERPPALPERPPALPERPPALPERPPALPDRPAPAPPAASTPAGPPVLPPKSATPSSKRISGLPEAAAEDEPGNVPFDIVREATGVLSQIRISHTTTAKQALDKFVSSMNSQRIDPTAVWQFYEVFETPPIERQLADDEVVLEAKLAWPRTEGCRFVAREVQPDLVGQALATVQGKLEKRGGSHKNWKTRHFILQPDRDLAYYAKTPKAKEMDSPIGTFTLDNKCLVYEVRHLKKAPRVDMCFCLKQHTTPLWPGDSKEKVMDGFEESCKFMCAFTPEERVIWIASIRKVIKESKFVDKAAHSTSPGDSSDEEKEEADEHAPPQPVRPVSTIEASSAANAVAAAAAAAVAAAAAPAMAPVPAMPSVVPTAAASGPPMPGAPRDRPEPAPRKKVSDGVIPDDFVPIKPKPVKGVGFGNIQVALPRRSQAEDAE